MEDLVALYTIWIFGGTGVKLAFTIKLWWFSTKREKNQNAISRLYVEAEIGSANNLYDKKG